MRSRAVVLAIVLAFGPTVVLGAQDRVRFVDARFLLPDGSVASSLTVDGGRIVAAGAAAPSSANAVASPRTRVVSLGGGFAVPAFTDHHVHVLNVGLWALNDAEHERLFVDLSSVTSLDALRAKLRERTQRTPRGAWIVGAGWNQAAWGTQALPTARDLAGVSDAHPIFLARSDGHAGWANVQALAAAGLTLASAEVTGGSMKDGVLLERANESISALLPALSDADIRRAWRLGAEALAARGVVEVYDAGALAPPGVVALNAEFGRYLRLLVAEDAARPLPIRINLMIPAPSELANTLLSAPSPWTLSPRLRITHLKFFADGALGSRGAWLSHPYADAPETRGVRRTEPVSFAALALLALDHGLGLATHAIGDAAVGNTLDAYERMQALRPSIPRGRLRIEHASYLAPRDLERAAHLGVLLSMQSNFNSADSDHPPFGTMRVGESNEPRVYPWAELRRLGADLAEGSDYFARPLGPLAGFEAAMTRRHAIGAERPDSAMRVAMLAMQAERRTPDGVRDAIAFVPGAPADFVVLDANPLTVPLAALGAVRSRVTVREGRIVADQRRQR
ncbi:MAG: amidohydrolase family protein [Gemmatimonadetes bacterium]|nr:amidohydrolase family protein [Gemmatimonadota bacterium]